MTFLGWLKIVSLLCIAIAAVCAMELLTIAITVLVWHQFSGYGLNTVRGLLVIAASVISIDVAIVKFSQMLDED